MASQYGKLVNKQFNSPINLYSENNIRDVLDRETQMLSNGAVGINFHNPTSNKPGNLQNSAVLRFLEEEEQRKKGGPPSLKRVAWPPASDAEGHLSEISHQDLDGPQISSVGLQNNQSPSANYQQSVTSQTYQPTPISPNYRPVSPKPNVSPMRHSPVPPGKQWAPVHSPIATQQTKPPSFPSPQTYSPQQYPEESLYSPQQYQEKQQRQFVSPKPQTYAPQQYSEESLHSPQQYQEKQQQQRQFVPPKPQTYAPQQYSEESLHSQQQYQEKQQRQFVQQTYQPVDNAQPWSPQLTQQQQQQNYGTPQQPQQYHQQPTYRPVPVVEPPPTTIHLRQETPVNQIPAGVYTSQPATATLKGGKNLRGDLKWPPPETKAQMEIENQARVDLARGPVCRPRKVKRDYSGFFAQHALNNTYPGYKIPPGTQFYAQERMS